VFYYIYFIVVAIFYIVATPFLLILSFKSKYKQSIPSRFFLINNPSFKSDGLHFHTCSLGESKAIKPIVDKFDKDILRFSTITQTGYETIKQYSKQSRYLPFEIFLPFWLKRQKVLVVFEAELWYMLFATAKKNGAKTFLINARINEKSYNKYLRFKWLYNKIFEKIDFVYAQSEDDAKRLKSLGAKNIKISGNLKLASIPKATKELPKNFDLIITAGSTHKGEEEIILDAFIELKKTKNAQLIIAPRHPERFDDVSKYIKSRAKELNLSFSRFSQNQTLKSDIIILDILGQLVNAYKISDVVIIGGAFEKIGGHNVLEAAQFQPKIISGKYYFNQIELFKYVDNLTIIDSTKLKTTLLEYEKLPKSKINTNFDIDNIIKDIQSVL